uniref:Zgc:171490 n=1 Tax=Cyprinus carpio carpio TaxID=630221 RepID=A0A8C1A1X7_CYPCA
MFFFLLFRLCVFFMPGVFTVITDRVTVSVMEGDSVTLYTNVTTTQQDEILWYFNDTRIAVITGDLSRICTDVQCNEDTERFRDRLSLENQTGSLTIKNIQTADTGVYQLKIFSRSSISEKTFSVTVLDVPDKLKTISVKEGESVTFDPSVIKTANYVMTWYFNDSLIAEITGDQSKICTDDECKERFRDRLKLNNQTGSLTITNTRTTDSGDYKVLIISHILQHSVSITSLKTFIFTVIDSGLSSAAVAGICVAVGVAVVLLFVAAAAAGVIYYRKRPQAGQNSVFSVITARVTVSVMKGDSVTLYTNVTTTQQDEILWYFNDTRIAMIAGDLSRICTDVQCNEDTERFRDRLNLENQTGSLTIKNIQTADTGVYQLKIFSRSSIREKTFSVTVDVPDKVKTISVKEGESVTFDPGVIKTANYVMRWYFNDL